MTRYRFQAAGYAGGWFNIFTDTEGELQSGAIDQLRKAGFGVVSVVVEANAWDATDRILHNTFQYRLTATLDSNQPANVALSTFAQTIEQLAGQPATVSNLGAGDQQQNLPDSNPLPDAAGILTGSLGLVLAIGVVVLLIVAKVK